MSADNEATGSSSANLCSRSFRRMMRRFNLTDASISGKEAQHENSVVGDDTRMFLERRYSDTAVAYVKEKSERSLVMKNYTYKKVPHLKLEQMELGDLLGSGGFCDVRKVHTISDVRSLDIKTKEKAVVAAQNRISMNSIYPHPKNRHTENSMSGYAIKYIRRNVGEDPDLYALAVQDLALEAEFLVNLDHTNIVKIHAMSALGLNGFDQNGDAGYFFMLEELGETLADKCFEWVKTGKKHRASKTR